MSFFSHRLHHARRQAKGSVVVFFFFRIFGEGFLMPFPETVMNAPPFLFFLCDAKKNMIGSGSLFFRWIPWRVETVTLGASSLFSPLPLPVEYSVPEANAPRWLLIMSWFPCRCAGGGEKEAGPFFLFFPPQTGTEVRGVVVFPPLSLMAPL